MRLRPAEIGDRGNVVGLESHGSIAALVLQIGEDEQAYLYGDWRTVADLAANLTGEPVEVVEGEGSAYSAHDVRPLNAADLAPGTACLVPPTTRN